MKRGIFSTDQRTDGRTDGQTDGQTDGRTNGQVRENDATSGPNSIAEAEMDWVELVRSGRVWQ